MKKLTTTQFVCLLGIILIWLLSPNARGLNATGQFHERDTVKHKLVIPDTLRIGALEPFGFYAHIDSFKTAFMFGFDTTFVEVVRHGDKWVANKPYSIKQCRNALIVYKSGVKVGAFTFYTKSPEFKLKGI